MLLVEVVVDPAIILVGIRYFRHGGGVVIKDLARPAKVGQREIAEEFYHRSCRRDYVHLPAGRERRTSAPIRIAGSRVEDHSSSGRHLGAFGSWDKPWSRAPARGGRAVGANVVTKQRRQIAVALSFSRDRSDLRGAQVSPRALVREKGKEL